MKQQLLAFLIGGVAFAAVAEDIILTEDIEITVPSGMTRMVEKLGGTDSFTLTKKGGGVLEVHWVDNPETKVIVAEGEFRVTNPRPSAIDDAYFHMDASELDSLELTTVNGTNFVTRWNDADGRERFASNCTTVRDWRPNPDVNRPFISSVTQNGLPVVDFGPLAEKHLVSADGEALGYGGALSFDQVTPAIHTAFSVVSETEDYQRFPEIEGLTLSAVTWTTFFSHDVDRVCLRGAGIQVERSGVVSPQGAFGDGSYNADILNNACINGQLAKGMASSIKYARLSPGFNIVSIRPDESSTSIKLNTLSGSRSYASSDFSYGGQRIGEYVLFTNRLSDVEYDAVYRYLRVKWFQERVSFSGVTVKAGAKLAIDDSLKLAVGRYVDESGAGLELGSGCALRTGVLLVAETALHLDASDAGSLEVQSENGTNFVTRWHDTTGNGLSVYTNGFKGFYNQRTNPEKRLPFLNPDKKLNGLNVIDFGSPITSTYTNENGEAVGYGASMMMNTKSENAIPVRQFFLVVSDHESYESIPANSPGIWPGYFGSGTMTSQGLDNGSSAGQRGARSSEGGYPTIYPHVATCYPVSKGTNYFDNVRVANAEAYQPTAGFHIYDARLVLQEVSSGVFNDYILCNRIARSSRNSGTPKLDAYGGYLFGECMFFNHTIPETDRQAIYDALRTKWWGDEVKGTRSYSDLRIPASSGFEVEYENLAVTGTLALGGTVKAPAVSAANLTALAAATVTGPLSLGEGAVVSFAQGETGEIPAITATSLALPTAATVKISVTDAKILKGKSVKLFDSTSIVGSVEGWNVEVAGYMVSGVKLAVRADGVYADIPKPGLMLLFR